MADTTILDRDALDSQRIERLLTSAFPQARILSLQVLKGGANNRVVKVKLADGAPLVAKLYFQHPLDPRPRLKSEFEFLRFAWNEGIRTIPKPLFQDSAGNLALYSFVEGDAPTAAHATDSFVHSAIDFLFELNQNRNRGNEIGKASESCFLSEDYAKTVERKLDRLVAAPKNELLRQFVEDEVLPRWKEVCKADLHGLQLCQEDLILTPSDFGLHNALIQKNGCPCFIDFEYAGWDDPAKTIADFFLQPRFPIPLHHFQTFARRVCSLSKDPEKSYLRTIRVLPLCRIKWCCIALNGFLGAEKQRREFAGQPASLDKQIYLARNYLSFSAPTDQR